MGLSSARQIIAPSKPSPRRSGDEATFGSDEAWDPASPAEGKHELWLGAPPASVVPSHAKVLASEPALFPSVFAAPWGSYLTDAHMTNAPKLDPLTTLLEDPPRSLGYVVYYRQTWPIPVPIPREHEPGARVLRTIDASLSFKLPCQ